MTFFKTVLFCAVLGACAPEAPTPDRISDADDAALRAADCFGWSDSVLANIRAGAYESEPDDGKPYLVLTEGRVGYIYPDGLCEVHYNLTAKDLPFGDYTEQYIRDTDTGALFMLQLRVVVDTGGWIFVGGRYLSEPDTI